MRAGIIAVVIASAGCGVQLGAGAHFPGKTQYPYAGTVAGRVHSPRGTGPFAGGHLTLADPGPEARFGIRHGIGTVGYRVVRRHGGIELGGEAGVGEPAFEDLGEPALYGGLSGALLFRIHGDQDVEPGFAPMGVIFDTVVTGRGGLWLPATSEPDPGHRWGGSLHLDLRITLLSDLFDVEGEELAP